MCGRTPCSRPKLIDWVIPPITDRHTKTDHICSVCYNINPMCSPSSWFHLVLPFSILFGGRISSHAPAMLNSWVTQRTWVNKLINHLRLPRALRPRAALPKCFSNASPWDFWGTFSSSPLHQSLVNTHANPSGKHGCVCALSRFSILV